MTDGVPSEATALAEVEGDGSVLLEERIALGGRGLREHTARGTIINSLFQIGYALLNLIRRLGIAIFLTTSQYGLWGIIVTTLMTLGFLKQVGINDKYIQQDEPDQELAFQKAFTLELAYTLLFYAFIVIALPLYALAYGRPEIILPGFVFSLAFLATAMQAPIWIAYRQMRFVRQRSLEAIDPVLSVIVTLALGAAGAGYWSLVVGAVVGSFSSAAAAIAWSPYKLAWHFDRQALRDYFSFSWPLTLSAASGLVIVQGSILIGNYTVGLAGLGALGLASVFASFGDRVDDVIRNTIYPAVCAIQNRRDLLFEVFVKSNRLALMWGLFIGVGLALFAPDLITFVLGEKWRPAQGLIQAFGLIIGFRQIAFNWTIFMRALNKTRPIAVGSVIGLVNFAAITAPLMIAFGLTGFAIGTAIGVCINIGVRAYYLSRLFEGFRLGRHAVRAVLPALPAAAVVLGWRLLLPLHRTSGVALGELCLYVVVSVVAMLIAERELLTEIRGYLRRGSPALA
jgi:O-antigen/teichoic acid export membrane protein